MSLKTWKKKFYPVPAETKMTKLGAVEHSIQKWTGLLPSNLEKHEVCAGDGGVCDYDNDENLEINQSTCALCYKYYDELGELDDNDYSRCLKCPLYKTLGFECGNGEDWAPFTAWMQHDDPKPMIKALKATLKKVKAGEV